MCMEEHKRHKQNINNHTIILAPTIGIERRVRDHFDIFI